MIFVTVGTHEQQFNRLLEKVDFLKQKGILKDEVIMQTGFSKYEPKYCQSINFIRYDDMAKYIDQARIVITHGGPASFISVISKGKTPIVVPRMSKYKEHVNDHQLDFARKLIKRGVNITLVEDIEFLEQSIIEQNSKIMSFDSNNENFNLSLKKIIIDLLN